MLSYDLPERGKKSPVASGSTQAFIA